MANWATAAQAKREQIGTLSHGDSLSFVELATLDQNRTHNLANEIAPASPDPITEGSGQTAWATPGYDKAGNMTTMPQPKSLSSSYAAAYDAWNRLVSLEVGSWRQEYEYDGLHRRIQKRTGSKDEFSTFVVTSHIGYYYNEQWQCLVETEGTGGGETLEFAYMWHPHYVDALAVRMRADEADEHFFTHDANFNITAVL